jgi:hypothetical protein
MFVNEKCVVCGKRVSVALERAVKDPRFMCDSCKEAKAKIVSTLGEEVYRRARTAIAEVTSKYGV